MARKKEIVMVGNPLLPGVTKTAEGYNFTVRVPEETEASLLLYKKNGKSPVREISLTDTYRCGECCSVLLPELQTKKFEYNYRINGKIVQDPYAYRICGRDTFGHMLSEDDEHEIRCGFLTEEEFDWEGDRSPGIPYEEFILYKLHVRGFTKLVKIPARLRGTFAGLKEMIPYLKELGVNGIEIMPAYDFAEVSVPEKRTELVRAKSGGKNLNYWGYIPGFYFAPKGSYSASACPENEMRELVKALHKSGIECIMEMYVPKGISASLVLDALRFWKMYYHVDGFHLVGAGISKRLMIEDGILKGTKLMADWFSDEELSLETGKGRVLADYNAKFLENMRQFLKSDAGMTGMAAEVLRENSRKKAFVNYMASQDGFTMKDMVSYNEKHNEANGHDNIDGFDYNFSWNCGEEGDTVKNSVNEFREKQIRNAFMMLLFSQGVPMIYAGDEFGNSQAGNNNAYCQDNPIGWIDWNDLKKHGALQKFVKDAIAFRKSHPVLHMSMPLQGSDYRMLGLPDISFHGVNAWECRFEEDDRLLGVMYCGDYAPKEDGTSDDMIYIGYNFHWGNRTLALPVLSGNKKWKKVIDSSESSMEGFFTESEGIYDKKIEVGPRTIVVLIGKQEA